MDRPSRSETDVLVVGAGPTGLVMATELAARGVSGRIIDRAPVRSERSRALVVQARSLELLQKMGVADELVARGRRTIKATPFVEGRPAANLEFGDIGVDDTPYPFLLFVSQAETERVLEKHLESLGAKVERPVELLSFEGDAEGVSARLRHGDGRQETARVRYLVGADGAHSTVRHTLGLSFKGDAYPQDFVLADTEIDWSGEDDRLYFFLSRKGLIAVFPLAGPSTYRLIATRAEDAPLDAGDPTLEEVQQLATELCPLPVRLYDPSWLARFRLHHRGVDSYRAGQAFVAGDAAHIHSPAGGQGMNTGIQDSYNLAWKLTLVIEGHAPDSILDSYHEERHPIGQRLLRTTDRMFNVAATHNPLTIELRNFLMPRVLPRVMGKRSLRARAFRFVSQLGIKYPDSPIVGEELDGADRAFRRGPAAGDRAPDGPLLLAGGGRQVSLFSRLRGTPHHLLLFGHRSSTADGWDVSDTELLDLLAEYEGLLEPHLILAREPARIGEEVPVYVDQSGLVYERYGLKGAGLYLIRPDGYVAFRAPGTGLQTIRAYLQRTFTSPAPLETRRSQLRKEPPVAVRSTPASQQDSASKEVRDVHRTTCCIVGGGPGGAVLALLLARKGIQVTLLEAHPDFDREFRGDTLHPSVMEIMDELGLADRLLELRHTELRTFTLQTAAGPFTPVDLSRLKTKFPYITMMPQTSFLEFITEEAKHFPNFRLVMGARVRELVEEDGVIRGVRYETEDGRHEVRALLTVGADGRGSRVRRLAGFEPVKTSPPMDVLWFKLPREKKDPEGIVGRFGRGHIAVMLDRDDYWQSGYVIPKGTYPELRREGIEALHRGFAELIPEFADRVRHLKYWQQASLLSVESSRCPRWYRPGLLLIGDAAHVMSPVGGVGINYAVQDAVVAANVLAEPLEVGQARLVDLDVRHLAAVQRRRELPTRLIQRAQALIQQQVLARALRSNEPFAPPLPLRLLLRVPVVRTIPSRIVAFGFWPVHVKE